MKPIAVMMFALTSLFALGCNEEKAADTKTSSSATPAPASAKPMTSAASSAAPAASGGW